MLRSDFFGCYSFWVIFFFKTTKTRKEAIGKSHIIFKCDFLRKMRHGQNDCVKVGGVGVFKSGFKNFKVIGRTIDLQSILFDPEVCGRS